MPRGGRRPGAGAPRGNTNAVRTGVYSPRLRRGTRLLLLLPEMRDLLRALLQVQDRKREDLFRGFVLLARAASQSQPDVQQTIKQLLLERLETAHPRIRKAVRMYADREKTIIQSNEDLIRLLAPSLYQRPVAADPALRAHLASYTDDHCPLVSCCLVMSLPCPFDRPWPEPHPFWLPSLPKEPPP